MILAGDVGGTKTVLAVLEPGAGEASSLTVVREATLPSREIDTLEGAVEAFLLGAPRLTVSAACVGVAGPVIDGRCVATNLPWEIHERRLAAAAHAPTKLVNDLEAAAHGVLTLAPEKFLTLQEGIAKPGANMALIDHRHGSRTSPVFNYPYAKSRAALAKLAAAGVSDPAHGVRMRYVNPVTGGWAMPTLGTFLQMLPSGFRSLPHRSTDGTVYCCVEGRGTIRIGDEEFEFGPRDVFVAPSWQARTLTASTDAVLFGYSDRPVQEALGLLREETLAE